MVWYINVAQRIRNDSADKSAWVEAADREKNLKSEQAGHHNFGHYTKTIGEGAQWSENDNLNYNFL